MGTLSSQCTHAQCFPKALGAHALRISASCHDLAPSSDTSHRMIFLPAPAGHQLSTQATAF